MRPCQLSGFEAGPAPAHQHTHCMRLPKQGVRKLKRNEAAQASACGVYRGTHLCKLQLQSSDRGQGQAAVHQSHSSVLKPLLDLLGDVAAIGKCPLVVGFVASKADSTVLLVWGPPYLVTSHAARLSSTNKTPIRAQDTAMVPYCLISRPSKDQHNMISTTTFHLAASLRT